MDRKKTAAGIAALLIAAISAGLLLRRGERPPEPAAPPMTSFLLANRSAAPEKNIAPKKTGVAAPRIQNLDDLQANIRKYYPEAEHSAGKEGRATIGLVVGADGTVRDVRIETSGGADFDEAARKVVLAMRFSPARSAGKPVAVEISEEIDFQFEGQSRRP